MHGVLYLEHVCFILHFETMPNLLHFALTLNMFNVTPCSMSCQVLMLFIHPCFVDLPTSHGVCTKEETRGQVKQTIQD